MSDETGLLSPFFYDARRARSAWWTRTGHLRSHAEEKPYQCKWPGCGKGFARQHDCKRHEQLHLNIRPYPCEGCKKNFARMDALNRHRESRFLPCHTCMRTSPLPPHLLPFCSALQPFDLNAHITAADE